MPVKCKGRVGGGVGRSGAGTLLLALCLLAPVLSVSAVEAQEGSEGGPAVEDVVLRDRLIADQEALLNVYRCLFDVDTHVVPGGCTNSAHGDDQDQGESGTITDRGQYTAISSGRNHVCALTAAGAIECWGAGEFP